MSRDRRIPVRRQAVLRRHRGFSPRPWWRPDLGTAVALLGLLAVAVLAPLLVFAALAPPGREAGAPGSPRGVGAVGSPGRASQAAATPPRAGDTAVGAGPARSPAAGAAPATPGPATRVPIVPVVGFWSAQRSISQADLLAALRGSRDRYREVIVPGSDRQAIAARLRIAIPRAVKSGTPAQIRAAVREGALGLLRASDVTPAVRALAIDGQQLFGASRVAALDAWPLVVEASGVRAEEVDPRRTWTLVAAGDILLDRGVARQVKVLGKGVDFPFEGGSAEITGYTCCSGFGHRVPTWRRTGDRGAVRSLLTRADLALANLESPVDDQFTYHTRGTVFSGDPKLLDGAQRAGFDYLSLGNNHIRDAGRDGILETIAELDRRRIAHSGAGENLAAARKPAVLQTRGVSVAVLSCDAVARGYWAGPTRTGSAPCDAQAVAADVRAAKARADLVIVYPHWGVEYRARPTPVQRSQAARWVEAGADIIIGNHAHWAAAAEQVNGKLVFYALGNFVFDQTWSERTMEGMLLELTFHGTTLRQAWIHPTLLIDQSQPNFLDPAGDGRRVLDQVRQASEGLLPY